MSKSELIKQIQVKHPKLKKTIINLIIDQFTETLKKSLLSDKKIEIRQPAFGTFFIKKKEENNNAINPRTGEKIFVEVN